MNTAMKLLAGLGVLREGEPDAAGTGSSLAFNPDTSIQQQEGLFEAQKEQLRKQQQEEEEDDTDDLTKPVTDDKQQQQQQTQEEKKTPENGSEAATEHVFEYKGVQVEVENAPEMVEAFKEKGLDIDKVNSELFSEAGLTAETKQSLYDAFGKLAVDMYLDGWTKQHEALVLQYNTSSDAWVQARTSLAEKETGGKWNEVLEWSQKNLSDAEYKQYQDIINGDNDLACAMALRELTAKSGLGGDGSLTVPKSSVRELAITPANNPGKETDGAISYEEYQEALKSREYWKDPAGWDARRRLGQQQGI